jgi:hypothetical protein
MVPARLVGVYLKIPQKQLPDYLYTIKLRYLVALQMAAGYFTAEAPRTRRHSRG